MKPQADAHRNALLVLITKNFLNLNMRTRDVEGVLDSVLIAEKVKAHAEPYEEAEIDEKCEAARHCRLEKAWDEVTEKLVRSAPGVKEFETVISGMKQLGAVKKLGRAPVLEFENQLQSWLEALEH